MDKSQWEWLLMVVNGSPIQTTEQARIKAAWLVHICDQLEAE